MTTMLDAGTVARLSEGAAEPSWLQERRQEAFERYASLPWPDMAAEEWRHTDLRGLDAAAFDLAAAPEQRIEVPEHPGVRVAPVARAAAEDADFVRAWLGRGGTSDHEAKLVAFNAAFGHGTFVSVARGATVDAPVVIVRSMAPGAAMAPRNVIVAGEGSSVTVIDRYEGGEGPGLCVPVVEIYAEPGATVNYLSVQDWPRGVWHLGSMRAIVGRDATVRSLDVALGATLARSVAQAVLDGQGAHGELLGLSFGDGDQHIDSRTLQLHRAPHTSSNVYYKGALKGSARSVYSGLVDLEKEGTMADAQQANRNLLLSDGARADASPFLEIKTSEVTRATHGVSVGRPDDETLFYLRSRGLDEREAERLFVTGFFQEIIDRVHVPDVKAMLETAVEAELALED